MSITIRSFGHTREGRPVTLLRMENAAGACAEVLDYGARLRSMVVPDRDGKPQFPLVKDMNPLYQSTFPINR